MRRVNRVFTNPLMGTIAWIMPPMAMVHHVGRKSGKRYHTPVVAFRSPKGFVIPMTYGRDVDWGRNLLSARGCELVQYGRQHVLHNPRIVDRDIAYRHLPGGVRSVLWGLDLPGYVLLDAQPTKTAKSAKRSRSRH